MDLTIIENVQRHGWHVVMVPEDEIGPGFAYTIGVVKKAAARRRKSAQAAAFSSPWISL